MLVEYRCKCFLHWGVRSRHRRGGHRVEGKVEHCNGGEVALVQGG